jgi:hypothetical protein
MSTEVKKYGVVAGTFDFGVLNSRNQLVARVLNPALDELLALPRLEHVVDSGTLYSFRIMLVAEREVPDEPGTPEVPETLQ